MQNKETDQNNLWSPFKTLWVTFYSIFSSGNIFLILFSRYINIQLESCNFINLSLKCYSFNPSKLIIFLSPSCLHTKLVREPSLDYIYLYTSHQFIKNFSLISFASKNVQILLHKYCVKLILRLNTFPRKNVCLKMFTCFFSPLKQESDICTKMLNVCRFHMDDFQPTTSFSLLAWWLITKIHSRAVLSSHVFHLRMNSLLFQVVPFGKT